MNGRVFAWWLRSRADERKRMKRTLTGAALTETNHRPLSVCSSGWRSLCLVAVTLLSSRVESSLISAPQAWGPWRAQRGAVLCGAAMIPAPVVSLLLDLCKGWNARVIPKHQQGTVNMYRRWWIKTIHVSIHVYHWSYSLSFPHSCYFLFYYYLAYIAYYTGLHVSKMWSKFYSYFKYSMRQKCL